MKLSLAQILFSALLLTSPWVLLAQDQEEKPAVFEIATGVGATLAKNPSGKIEGAAVSHSTAFGNLSNTYGAGGGSIGVGNNGLSLEFIGDGGWLLRPNSLVAPAVGLDLGIGMRADTARDEVQKPMNSEDWLEVEANIAAGLVIGRDYHDCKFGVMAQIGGVAGGQGAAGGGLQLGEITQLNCPGLDLALTLARQNKERDGVENRVDIAALYANLVTDRESGMGFGVRLESISINQDPRDIDGLDCLNNRAFLVIQFKPTAEQ